MVGPLRRGRADLRSTGALGGKLPILPRPRPVSRAERCLRDLREGGFRADVVCKDDDASARPIYADQHVISRVVVSTLKKPPPSGPWEVTTPSGCGEGSCERVVIGSCDQVNSVSAGKRCSPPQTSLCRRWWWPSSLPLAPDSSHHAVRPSRPRASHQRDPQRSRAAT